MGGSGSVAGAITRGDIRLCPFARPDKRRPVVVLTRDTSIPHLAAVTVAPVTSTIRGVASEVQLSEADGMKKACAVNLHNLVTVPKDWLGKQVGTLSPEHLEEICKALGFALGCIS